ncbi:MAG: hypothetical protein HYY17_15380 [Planctomycetes bacterium]|nr:hypothetical protein [Planctomycetota bacterium]
MTRRPIHECAICRDLAAHAGMLKDISGLAECPGCGSRYRRDGDRLERVLPDEPIVPKDLAGAIESDDPGLRAYAGAALARHHMTRRHPEEVARLLEHKDDAIRRAALGQMIHMRPEEAAWEILVRLPAFLEREDDLRPAAFETIRTLAERGIDMTAVFQICLYALRYKDEKTREWPLRFVRDAIRKRYRINLDPYTGKLVDILIERAPGPEAEAAVELLDRAAATDPEGVSTSLFIRWPDEPTPLFKRLLRRLKRRDPNIVKEARRTKPDLQPVSVRRILKGVRGAAGPFLVVQGQYSPSPSQSVRIGILQENKVLADAWLATADFHELVNSLAKKAAVRTGEWDVMYATGWGLAWTTDRPPFELWDSEGRLAWQEGDEFRVRAGGRCRIADLLHIEAYLEEGWVLRGVRCVLRNGDRIGLAEVRDMISTIDPTYDGINIMCEASWTVSVAGAVGAALGVPVVKDEAL